ncbi:hypothetical protein NTD84_03540 [Pseudomonas sp. 14P_8.1_Bac3]|uniref:hypothetical protein n=1 Tax=Pseudomonas sp. 14P_8.1_Bac3 TaxID=2971621 RepID=UPI0021C81C88|nr:hypothetical protein [Pseudomonas sp. 14P_8.1_Bac3]MCU1758795.1 hypothetical protein [Pseudomonas sp. 14P_8.1_Bac3]
MFGAVGHDATATYSIGTIGGDAVIAYSISTIGGNTLRVGASSTLRDVISMGAEDTCTNVLRASLYCPTGDSKCATNG